MGQTLVKDVFYRASVLLQDASPQFVRWTEREMVAWLNDAQRAVSKYLPSSCSRIDSIKLSPGTRQSIASILAASMKPGDGSTPANVGGVALLDVIRNMGADGATTGRSVRVVSREVMDSQAPDWHSRPAATAIDQFMFDPRTPKYFYVSPPVHATTAVWVECAYMADPVQIVWPGSATFGMDGTSTVAISVDDKHVDDLVNYIVARAYSKDAEFASNAAQANTYTQLFLTSLNAQATALTGVNPNLTTLPMNANIPAAAK